MWSGEEVTTIKSKVTLMEGHRTAKLGAIKIAAVFKKLHSSSNNAINRTQCGSRGGKAPVRKPEKGLNRMIL